MILSILSILLFLIFVVLGGFHFYWLFGGSWGVDQVIPKKSNDDITPGIPKLATLVVGVGLILFGLVYLMKSGLIVYKTDLSIIYYSYWIIPFIFILRAIGEFKYVGFFKTIKDTKFARADSLWFTPLCLGIGIMGMLILLI